MRWRGKWTGIPRTISCVLQEWLREPRGLRLCRFDGFLRQFCETPLERVRQLLERQERAEPAPPRRDPAETDAGAGESRLHSAWRSLPVAVREPLCISAAAAKSWYVLGRGCGRVALRASSHLCRRAFRAARLYRGQARLFEPGDVLLSPGGSWEHKGYLDAVARHRLADGLLLAPLIYDLIPYRFPQFFPSFFPPEFRKWLARLLGLTDRAFAISESTRADLRDFAAGQPLTMPPCEVIRLGDRFPVRGAVQPPPLEGAGGLCPTPFVLMVGTVEVRKNHALIYQVWRHLLQEHGPVVPPLVIAGQRGWLCDELRSQIEHDPCVQRKILFARGLNDGELTWLYQNCLFTVYPSHYEGWGLPVGESLSHGKYCIASSSSSLPEIAGDLVRYHHPLDFPACKCLAAQAIFDASYRREREADIRRFYRTVSWSETASVLWAWLQEMPCGQPDALRRCA
jgi:glycosyltransferase involved in cell wall biosynthesis